MKHKMFLTVGLTLIFILGACTTDDESITIEFDLDSMESIEVSVGEEISLPDPDIEDDETFNGWFLESSFETEFEEGMIAEEDLLLYGYIESIDDDDDTDDDADDDDDDSDTDTDDSDDGDDSDTDTDDSDDGDDNDEEGPFTLSFENTGNVDLPEQTLDEGETISFEVDFFKVGHLFMGWYSDEDYEDPFEDDTMPGYDLVLYARFDPQEFTLTIHTYDETIEQVFTYDETLDLEEYEAHSGLSFEGWFNDEDYEVPFDHESMPAFDLEIHGEFNEVPLEATIESNTDVQFDALNGEYGETVELPEAPEVDGYYFTGFYYDDDFSDPIEDSLTLTNDITIYANYIETSTHTISFETNDGDSIESVTLETGETLDDSLEASKEGYDFAGWFKDSDFETYIGYDTPVTESMTLYAAYGTEGLAFEWNDKENYYEVSIGEADSDHILIPPVHNGDLVGAVAHSGFATYDDEEPVTFSEVTFPNTIEKIHQWAFFLAELETLHLPPSLTYIGLEAFAENYHLETLIFDEDSIIESTGQQAFWNATSLTNIVLPDSLIEIADWAFYNNSALTSIDIPKNVETIGIEAFSQSENLSTIYFRSNDSLKTIKEYAFYDMISLTSFTVPNTVETIEYGAFYGTYDLHTFTFEEDSSLTYFGGYQFDSNREITSIELPETVEYFGFGMFRDATNVETVYFNDSLEEIGNFAFAGSSVETLELPSSLKAIGQSTFNEATNLETLMVPAAVESIGSRAFYEAENFREITFEDGSQLESMGSSVFAYSAIETLDLPEQLKTIDANSFRSTPQLEYVNFEGNVPKGFSVEDGALFNEDMTMLYHYPAANGETSYTIPETVTAIASYAFMFHQTLFEVNLPSNLEEIGYSSFREMDTLGSITIPDSVTTIYRNAFRDTESLITLNISVNSSLEDIKAWAFMNTRISSVTLPPSLNEVHSQSFRNNENLETVRAYEYFRLGLFVFDDTHEDLVITVPNGDRDEFLWQTTSPWQDYSHRIEERD